MHKLPLQTALTITALSFAVAGCSIAGDRAAGNRCPSGETCSDLTPNGLFFVGTATTDNIFGGGLDATARGGRQTVTALTSSGSGSPEFDGDFDAEIENTSVLSVISVNPPSVSLRGKVFGATRLRLLESGTDKLLDRVEVEVQEVDRVSVFPSELMLVSDENAPWALLANSAVPLIARLHGQGDDRLVDEDLSLSAASGGALKKAWDLFEINAPATGEASFEIKAGDGSFPATAKVVPSIDDVLLVGSDSDMEKPITVTVNQNALVCFVARAGSAVVAGAAWTFTLPPNVKKSEEQLDLPLPSCVTLRGVSEGSAKLTVKAEGVSKSFDLTVNPKASAYHHPGKGQRLPVWMAPQAPTFGERAFLSGAQSQTTDRD